MPRAARIELWTALECNSGAREHWIEHVSGNQELALDNSDRLVVTISDKSAIWDAVASLQVLKIIRVTTHVGSGSEAVYEWRISSISDGEGARRDTIRIEGDPILYDLRNAVIRNDNTGGRPDYNLGGLRLSPSEYIDTYVLPALTDAGIDWVSRGTVDFGDGYNVGVSRATALEMLQELAAKTGGELRLRRNGSTDYQIDLLESVGSGSITPRVQFGRNLIEITRDQSISGYASRIYAMGKQVDGRSEISTIGYAAWEVSATATGNVVTLVDPGGGPGPVGFDDQLNGKYIYSPTGASYEVTDSVATADTVTLATAHGLTTGQHVTFFEDASNTLTTVLTNPGAETAIAVPIVTRVYSEDYREERNWVPNAIMYDWATGNTADGWLATGTEDGINGPIRHRDISATVATVTGITTDGAHGATAVWNLASLVTGEIVWPGDQLVEGANTRYVHSTGVANASGKCSVAVSSGYTASGGEAVTLNRPIITGAAGSSNAAYMDVNNRPSPEFTDGIWLKTPAIMVPYVTNDALIWASVGYTMYGFSSFTLIASPVDPDEMGVPVANLIHATSGSKLASGVGVVGAYASGANHAAIRMSYTLTADTPLQIKFRSVYTGNDSVGTVLHDPATFARWAQLTIGPDSRVPVVDGSHGTKLWQFANSRLEQAQLPYYIKCNIRDLADVDGYTLSEENITLGGNIHVVSSKLNLDTDVRVVSLLMDLVEPENTQVVLDTMPRVASARLSGHTMPYETQPEPEPAPQSTKSTAEKPDDPKLLRAIVPNPTASGGDVTIYPREPIVDGGLLGIEL